MLNNDSSFSNYNKKDSSYLLERLKKIKDKKNNIYNKYLFNNAFKNQIYLKKENPPIFNILSKRNLFNDNIMNIASFRNKRLPNIISSEKNNSILSNKDNCNLMSEYSLNQNKNKNNLSEININQSKEINTSFKGKFNSSSFSVGTNASSKTKFLIKGIHLNNGSYSERTNNTSKVSQLNFKRKSKVSVLRKIFFHKKRIKPYLSKSIQTLSNNLSNINKSKNYIVPLEKNNIFLNSLSIKSLSSDYLPSIKETKNNYIKTMNSIDLEIKDIVEKQNLKKKFVKEKEQKKKKIDELLKYFDFLPYLIAKKNYEQNEQKKDNLFNNDSENEKNNVKKIINPIIKYLYLQKILNSFKHKVDFVSSSFIKQNEIMINDYNNEELKKQIKDFITYGYEYIPEQNLKFKNYKDNKENINNLIFFNVFSNNYLKKNIINGSYNKQINSKREISGDISNEILNKNLNDNTNSNLMLKLLKKQNIPKIKNNNKNDSKTDNKTKQ